MNLKRFALLMGAAVLSTGIVMAQNYYDDDIYFDASKAPKKTNKVKVVKKTQPVTTTGYASDFPSSDSYTVVTSNTRDVDEYNRRGSYISSDTVAAASSDNFAYTKRIERFHNPDVVSNSGDEDLIYYYNSADEELQPATNVNVYVSTPGIWGSWYPSAWSWAWASPWYSPLAWSSPWYPASWGWDPYWNFNWGFSWNWGWGPSWSWGWGPSWNWGWAGPGWYPGHGPGHWHPAPARPASPGAYRPARPGGAAGIGGRPHHSNRYGIGSARRPGQSVSAGNVGGRPGSNMRPGSVQSHRPSYGTSTGSARPNGQQRPTVGVNGQRRGANTVYSTPSDHRNYNPSNATRPSGQYTPSQRPSNSGNYRQGANNNNRNSSTGSYRQQSNPSRSGSFNSGSWGSGGGRSGGSFGGGGRSGGSRGGAGGRH